MAIPPSISEYAKQTPVAPSPLPNVPPKLPRLEPPVDGAQDRQRSVSNPLSATCHRSRLRLKLPRHTIRSAVAAGFCFIALSSILLYATRAWSFRHSMLALAAARDRRDHETVAQYVDAKPLAESFRRCAVESIKQQMAKQASDDFAGRVGDAIGEEIVGGLVNVTFTPDSVVSMLCGEAPTDAMKDGVAKSTDQIVDAFTEDGSPKTKVYGLIAKVLIRLASATAIDEASAEARANQGIPKPDDYAVSIQCESAGRYLVTRTPRNSDDPAFGYVYKRHGLTTWKLTEIRLLPQHKIPLQANAGQRRPL